MPDKNAKKTEKADRKRNNAVLTVLYALVVISIIGYIWSGNSFVGLLAFILIIVTLIAEFRSSVKEEGAKKSIYDVAMAIIAVVVFYLLLCTVLGTTSPINVVASCSMLPNLQRGDAIILHGISNMSGFLEQNNVPIINLTPVQFSYLNSNIQDEFAAYLFLNPSNISYPYFSSSPTAPVALFNEVCASEFGYAPRCETDQSGAIIKYNYGVRNITINGAAQFVATTSSLTVLNETITENPNAPIIVYRTTPNDDFYPETIIHRLYAAIDVDGSYYMLTKGDNNPVLDMQSANYPINESDVVGYVVLNVPYLGYPSLIVKGQLSTPAGCNWVINDST